MRCPPLIARLVRVDWLLLVLLAPFLLYSERFSPLGVSLALAGLVALWLIRLWATRQVLPQTPLNLPLFCLLLTVPVSLYSSADFAGSLPKLTGLLFGVAVFFVAARASATRETFPVVLLIWWLSVVAISLLSLVTTDWLSKNGLLNQLTSRLPHLVTSVTATSEGGLHPNEVGGLMALFLPLALSMALAAGRTPDQPPALTGGFSNLMRLAARSLDPSRRVGRLLWLLVLLLLGGLLVFSQSRSALFGTTVAVMLVGAIRSKRLRWLIALAAVGALAALAVAGPSTVADSLFGGQSGAGSSGGSLDLAGREEVWNRALYAIQDFPFTGVGLNQFEPVVNLLYPLFLLGPDAKFTHAHNLYLQAAVDFGLGGLVAYTAIVVAALIVSVRCYRMLDDRVERPVVLGLAAGLLAQQLYGLSDAAIRIGTKPSFEWWLFLGMIVGIYAQSAAKTSPQPSGVRISRLEVFGLWVLTSLIAIAGVGAIALLGVGLALLGGCAVALSALVADAASQPRALNCAQTNTVLEPSLEPSNK